MKLIESGKRLFPGPGDQEKDDAENLQLPRSMLAVRAHFPRVGIPLDSYDALKNVNESDSVLLDCEKSFVFGQGGRLITCLGLKNCLVVDTKDALLVADLRRSQDIRKIVEQLKKKGKTELL